MKTYPVILAVLVLLLTGCASSIVGSGRVVTESRPVSDFDALDFSGVGEVTITQGDTESLTIQAEDNLMPLIRTQVKDRTLTIGVANQADLFQFAPTRPIRFNLAVKNLEGIEISGAGHVQSASLKSDRFSIKVNGVGSIVLDRLEANEVDSSVSGAGHLEIGGQVVNQAAQLSGLGNYQARNLNSQAARVTLTGAGNATLAAQDNLDVTITGAGAVHYYGNPRISRHIAGAGIVDRLGND